jgi:hypothetical protein
VTHYDRKEQRGAEGTEAQQAAEQLWLRLRTSQEVSSGWKGEADCVCLPFSFPECSVVIHGFSPNGKS